MPVVYDSVLLFNNVAYERNLAATHELRDYKGSYARNKNHRNARQYAGNGEGKRNAQKSLNGICAEVCRSFKMAFVKL